MSVDVGHIGSLSSLLVPTWDVPSTAVPRGEDGAVGIVLDVNSSSGKVTHRLTAVMCLVPAVLAVITQELVVMVAYLTFPVPVVTAVSPVPMCHRMLYLHKTQKTLVAMETLVTMDTHYNQFSNQTLAHPAVVLNPLVERKLLELDFLCLSTHSKSKSHSIQNVLGSVSVEYKILSCH